MNSEPAGFSGRGNRNSESGKQEDCRIRRDLILPVAVAGKFPVLTPAAAIQFCRSHSQMKIRSLTRQLLAVAGFCCFAGSGRADILVQYNFGPDGTAPAITTPTTTGLHLTATSITNDAGVSLYLA